MLCKLSASCVTLLAQFHISLGWATLCSASKHNWRSLHLIHITICLYFKSYHATSCESIKPHSCSFQNRSECSGLRPFPLQGRKYTSWMETHILWSKPESLPWEWAAYLLTVPHMMLRLWNSQEDRLFPQPSISSFGSWESCNTREASIAKLGFGYLSLCMCSVMLGPPASARLTCALGMSLDKNAW